MTLTSRTVRARGWRSARHGSRTGASEGCWFRRVVAALASIPARPLIAVGLRLRAVGRERIVVRLQIHDRTLFAFLRRQAADHPSPEVCSLRSSSRSIRMSVPSASRPTLWTRGRLHERRIFRDERRRRRGQIDDGELDRFVFDRSAGANACRTPRARTPPRRCRKSDIRIANPTFRLSFVCSIIQ